MKGIIIDNLTVKYGKRYILKCISAEFRKGKMYGIIGPNGVGKSTLLSAITKLIKIETGKVYINGKDNKKYSIKNLAREISFMSQSFELKFPYTIEQVVAMGRYPFSEGKLNSEDIVLVEKSLKEANLYDMRQKKINELSGGEKQRVLFAKTMCQNTDLILIDEGISNADIYYQIKFIKILKDKVTRENKTVLFIMHDLTLARKFCDEILILKDGNVYDFGTSKYVLNEKVLYDVFNVKGRFIGNALEIK